MRIPTTLAGMYEKAETLDAELDGVYEALSRALRARDSFGASRLDSRAGALLRRLGALHEAITRGEAAEVRELAAAA
jgi:hypothetical protein